MFKQLVRRTPKIFRYLVAGGTAAVVNLGGLYWLTEKLGWWYLSAGVVSFLVSLVVSFSLQKFWTFSNYDLVQIKRQLPVYTVVVLINLLINTSLLYFFVTRLGWWYMLGQVMAGAVVAMESFFVYKFLVFPVNENS